jgi:hypothetical protein
MIALCPKCHHELERDGCPDCGWGKPAKTQNPIRVSDLEPPVMVELKGDVRQHYEKLIRDLSLCRLLPFAYDKRFIFDMLARIDQKPETLQLSERQLAYLDDLQHRYRRQLTK